MRHNKQNTPHSAARIGLILAAGALGILLVLIAPRSAAAADPGIEFFEKKIRPVLVEHCLECHSASAKELKGSLALDTSAGVRAGGDTGPAIVAGKPGESLLIEAVRYANPDLQMPPKAKLSPEAIADLEQWIKLGAPDPRDAPSPASLPDKRIDFDGGRKFWSFVPPTRRDVPTVRDTAWPRTDIDRFVLARLESQQLTPVADADRPTLLRRVYFDLIGLPPTPDQVDAFVADNSPDAWPKVVDQLLASPHFGERWGRHWLDVARFAESTGGGRSLLLPDAWRYRDYVITSLNSDKPYDRFLTEQIAGDLLPASTLAEQSEQIVATAFLALGPTNYEGQDKQALEMDVIDEQIDTIGRAVLGMTLGCARCHDHKFDPISTRDYYALAGIFKSTQTLIHDNVSRWIDRPLPLPPEQEAVFVQHELQVSQLKARIAEAKKNAPAVVKAGQGVVLPRDLPGIVLDDSEAKPVGAWKHSQWSGSYIGDGYLHDENQHKGQKTLTFVPDIPKAGRYEVRLAYSASGNRGTKVPATILHAAGEATVHVNQQQTPSVDGRFVSLGQFDFEAGNQGFIRVSNDDSTGHVIVDAVQLLAVDAAEADRANSQQLLASVPDATDSNGTRGSAAGEKAFDLKAAQAELSKLLDDGPRRPQAMSVAESQKIEDCQICIRGNARTLGPRVPRGFLQVASAQRPVPLPATTSGRRELAAWLTGRDNPLAARVMVNRIWQHLFNTGLVRTTDHFGAVGEPPAHGELLDHLALDFMAPGERAAPWSIKKIIRQIVFSRVYQLASTPEAQALAADPENRLLWRHERRRLDAEAIRDSMLAVSGQLDLTAGGPTIAPGTTSEYGYEFKDCRRSVYTPIFRNRLLELFEAFDFADPNLSSGRRNVTTVSTQALYLLNSPFVMDLARAAAERATADVKRGDTDVTCRLRSAYRHALGRLPTEREAAVASEFLAAHRGGGSAAERAAWERIYQALFASIDFRYVH